MRHTFKAYERLKREQHIDTLFRTGKAFSVSPIRVIYLMVSRPSGEHSSVRTGFSAPKKKFRRAVDRNRLKRLMRESWRLQKTAWYRSIPDSVQLHIFFIFTGNEVASQITISETMTKCLARLSKELSADE